MDTQWSLDSTRGPSNGYAEVPRFHLRIMSYAVHIFHIKEYMVENLPLTSFHMASMAFHIEMKQLHDRVMKLEKRHNMRYTWAKAAEPDTDVSLPMDVHFSDMIKRMGLTKTETENESRRPSPQTGRHMVHTTPQTGRP